MFSWQYPAIKLPFSGKLLPVNAEETSQEETTSEEKARESVSVATLPIIFNWNQDTTDVNVIKDDNLRSNF